MNRPPHDGWVDVNAARDARGDEDVARSDEEDARRLIASFRGQVLAAAYSLESSLDTLILWHLFRDRQDGMAAFFEDHVLRDAAFGLDKKIRLACATIDYWVDAEEAPHDKARLGRARSVRNQIAHWPARLIPVRCDGETVGFDVQLVRDEKVIPLDKPHRLRILSDFEQAKARLNDLSAELAEHARRDDD